VAKKVRFEPEPRMCIADRKRAKKAAMRTKNHACPEEKRVQEGARQAYELFHMLPTGSSTIDQVRSSSSGIPGWFDSWENLWRPARKTTDTPTGLINILTRIPKIGETYSAGVLCPISKPMPATEDGWEMLEITVDSGAGDTVLPSGMLSSIQTMSTVASRAMEEYEFANGGVISKDGEKRCLMMTPGSATPKGIVFQVTGVHKPLMSVVAMCDAGYECLMSKEGGFMRDVETGEMIPLIRRGNLYMLQAWVRTAEGSPFGGPR
jgi:hypothetical protein